MRRLFLLPKNHFTAISQSFFVFSKSIVNGNYPLKLHFEPFTLFLKGVVRLNCSSGSKKIFQIGKKPSGLSFRIPIVI